MTKLIYLFTALTMSLFMPSLANAEITSSETLHRGTIIDVADLDFSKASAEESRQAQSDLVGKEVVRTIYVGRRIKPTDVTAPKIVKRNARVAIVYRSGRLEIRSVGRALEEGGAGETIKLMNVDSKEILFGMITPNGEVEVR